MKNFPKPPFTPMMYNKSAKHIRSKDMLEWVENISSDPLKARSEIKSKTEEYFKNIEYKAFCTVSVENIERIKHFCESNGFKTDIYCFYGLIYVHKDFSFWQKMLS